MNALKVINHFVIVLKDCKDFASIVYDRLAISNYYFMRNVFKFIPVIIM